MYGHPYAVISPANSSGQQTQSRRPIEAALAKRGGEVKSSKRKINGATDLSWQVRLSQTTPLRDDASQAQLTRADRSAQVRLSQTTPLRDDASQVQWPERECRVLLSA